MVILFKPEHVEPILRGDKTQTRRFWKVPRVKVGGTYQARTRLFDKSSTFARIWVIDLWRERLKDITLPEVHKEGYEYLRDFLEAIAKINHKTVGPELLNSWVWVIEFEVIWGLLNDCQGHNPQ